MSSEEHLYALKRMPWVPGAKCDPRVLSAPGGAPDTTLSAQLLEWMNLAHGGEVSFEPWELGICGDGCGIQWVSFDISHGASAPGKPGTGRAFLIKLSVGFKVALLGSQANFCVSKRWVGGDGGEAGLVMETWRRRGANKALSEGNGKMTLGC